MTPNAYTYDLMAWCLCKFSLLQSYFDSLVFINLIDICFSIESMFTFTQRVLNGRWICANNGFYLAWKFSFLLHIFFSSVSMIMTHEKLHDFVAEFILHQRERDIFLRKGQNRTKKSNRYHRNVLHRLWIVFSFCICFSRIIITHFCSVFPLCVFSPHTIHIQVGYFIKMVNSLSYSIYIRKDNWN